MHNYVCEFLTEDEILKNLKKIKENTGFFVVFLTFFAVILLFSCDMDTDGRDVDFSSHNTNYSILVRNNTGERLVAF